MIPQVSAPAARPVRRAGPALGTHAKSAVRGTVHDDAIRRRWAMHRAAQGLLSDKRPAGGGDYLAFVYRLAMCQRGKTGRPGKRDNGKIGIYRNEDGTRAEYQNLQTCGSVWHCPI